MAVIAGHGVASNVADWATGAVAREGLNAIIITLLLGVLALLLSRTPAASGFLASLAWGKTYHVLHPFEGLLLAQGLLLFYSLLNVSGANGLETD